MCFEKAGGVAWCVIVNYFLRTTKNKAALIVKPSKGIPKQLQNSQTTPNNDTQTNALYNCRPPVMRLNGFQGGTKLQKRIQHNITQHNPHTQTQTQTDRHMDTDTDTTRTVNLSHYTFGKQLFICSIKSPNLLSTLWFKS